MGYPTLGKLPSSICRPRMCGTVPRRMAHNTFYTLPVTLLTHPRGALARRVQGDGSGFKGLGFRVTFNGVLGSAKFPPCKAASSDVDTDPQIVDLSLRQA